MREVFVTAVIAHDYSKLLAALLEGRARLREHVVVGQSAPLNLWLCLWHVDELALLVALRQTQIWAHGLYGLQARNAALMSALMVIDAFKKDSDQHVRSIADPAKRSRFDLYALDVGRRLVSRYATATADPARHDNAVTMCAGLERAFAAALAAEANNAELAQFVRGRQAAVHTLDASRAQGMPSHTLAAIGAHHAHEAGHAALQ